MSNGRLDGNQLQQLKDLVGMRATRIDEYYWRMEGEAPLLDYIKLLFGDSAEIVVRVGSTGENIDTISSEELESELERRDRSMFIKSLADDNSAWRSVLHHPVIDVTIKDETGYADCSIVFHTIEGATEITTKLDALEVLAASKP